MAKNVKASSLKKPKDFVDPSAMVYVPGIGKIKAGSYAEQISKSRHAGGHGEKYNAKVKLFLNKMVALMTSQHKQNLVPRVWAKDIRQINKEVKAELKSGAGISVRRLMNDHYIERIVAEHSRPIYAIGVEGEKLLGLASSTVPVEEHMTKEHEEAVTKGIEELTEEE
jgi:hypothetical protein